MKKVLPILFCAMVVAICFLTYFPSVPVQEEKNSKTEAPWRDKKTLKHIRAAKQSPPADLHEEIADVLPETPAPPPIEIKPPSYRTITHSVGDFKAWGQFENTVADTHLRLENGSAEATSATDYHISGLYTSIQDLTGLFDQITFHCESVVPAGGALTFEFRTSNDAGQWSDWQQSSGDQPIKLAAPATGWQYRLALFASTPNSSPEITKVTVVTEDTVRSTVTTSLAPN
ncbi:MAG: hypothetical protein M3Y82_09270 [Verrucomicrobiota bacterium]|nr:hypothetical protein [Verrucomicrobiota bacterium]